MRKKRAIRGLSGGNTIARFTLLIWTEASIASGGIAFVLVGIFGIGSKKWDVWGGIILKRGALTDVPSSIINRNAPGTKNTVITRMDWITI